MAFDNPHIQQVQAGIRREIDSVIVDGQVKRPRSPGLHCSTVIEKEKDRYGNPVYCPRKGVLEMNFVPDETLTDAYQLAVFRNGELLHDRWQEWFVNSGRVSREGIEKRHISKDGLQFTIDGFPTLGAQRYVLEIKGYNQETCLEILASRKPPQDALVQCNMYLHLLRYVYGEDVMGDVLGLILVENKNQKKLTEKFVQAHFSEYVGKIPAEAYWNWYWVWVIEYDASLAAPYQGRIDKLVEANVEFIRTGDAPPRLSVCTVPSDRRAQQCSMRDVCFSGIVQRERRRIAQKS